MRHHNATHALREEPGNRAPAQAAPASNEQAATNEDRGTHKRLPRHCIQHEAIVIGDLATADAQSFVSPPRKWGSGPPGWPRPPIIRGGLGATRHLLAEYVGRISPVARNSGNAGRSDATFHRLGSGEERSEPPGWCRTDLNRQRSHEPDYLDLKRKHCSRLGLRVKATWTLPGTRTT